MPEGLRMISEIGAIIKDHIHFPQAPKNLYWKTLYDFRSRLKREAKEARWSASP